MEILQHKDGVLTARIRAGKGTCIVKQFEDPNSAREIGNYRLLSALNVPTLRVLEHTDRTITLEDIAASDHWRLGQPEDLSNPDTAAAIARWYRQLHECGRGEAAPGMYDESDLFTMENIRKLPEYTRTQGYPIWELLESRFDVYRSILDELPRTLTYNDFYWSNLAVSRDGREALMFDYNLMSRGYAYSDIRNVTVSLRPEAARAFLTAYGSIDPLEQAVDDVADHIITLILAARRETFPHWAEPSRTALRDLLSKAEALLAYIEEHPV